MINRSRHLRNRKGNRKGVRNLFRNAEETHHPQHLEKVSDTFSGFTLLEIILSLAILAGSLAALGEVMRLADRNAEMVRDESQAQILAASVMDELLAGSRQMMAVNQEPFEINSEPPWVYSVAFEETPYLELLLARVRVEQQLPPQQQPAKFELVRWVPNPDNLSATTTEETSEESSGSSSNSASGGSSTGSGSTTGGTTQ
jgi:prepilin-type N-terminal cleavage/methylation domain-containing protein